ncbi:MAG TPA: DUF177 domain-containing protein, partial [Holophagaceae bacterium]|nr:DUF177 domain-containing protein [Holophagaceae bacterium]
ARRPRAGRASSVIDLRKLPSEGLRVSGKVDHLALDGGAAIRDLGFELFVMPSDKDIFLDLRGQGLWQGVCARCLEPLDRPMTVESQFLGSSDPELVSRGAHTLGTQDLDVVFIPEAALQEESLVREQFELQAPSHPLCKESCEGLCPVCGKNWNKGKCSCKPEFQKEPSALAKALQGLKLDL